MNNYFGIVAVCLAIIIGIAIIATSKLMVPTDLPENPFPKLESSNLECEYDSQCSVTRANCECECTHIPIKFTFSTEMELKITEYCKALWASRPPELCSIGLGNCPEPEPKCVEKKCTLI